MRTIVVASGKGGTLKSSLVASLGVYAAGEAKTALIDLNADQATLTRWWKARGEPANPFLVEEIEGQLHHELRALDKIKRVHCLIDTPPDEMKTSPSEAIEPTQRLCAECDIRILSVGPNKYLSRSAVERSCPQAANKRHRVSVPARLRKSQ